MHRVAAAPDPFRIGLSAILLVASGYTVAIAVLAAAGAEMTIPAWLPIPGDIYYPVETVFIGPLTVVLWLVAGWLAHRLAGLAVGRGTLRTTAGMLAVAIAISSLPTRVPDLVTGVLFLTGILPRGEWLEMTSGGFWQGVDIGYLALYLIGFAVLFPAAIRVGEGVSRRAAAAIGLLSFAACQVPYLIAVR